MKKRNAMLRACTAALLLVGSPLAAAAQDASILNPSGQPIPRYVSLKSGEVNVRVGPGKRYPIRYVYKRAGLPVQIVEEFAHWRKIKDFEGSVGWVHKGMLSGVRMAMILDKPQNLYGRPEVSDSPVMRAEPTVIGHVQACLPDWCLLEIAERDGWIRKPDIWGVGREEVFKE